MTSIKLPLWLRFLLVVAVLILAAAGGLFGYRYYTHPKTLTVAVGSINGEASKAMSAIASRLVTDNASVRLKVIDSGTALEAGKAFAAGTADLAVVRGDVGDLSQAGAVVIVAHMVALIIAILHVIRPSIVLLTGGLIAAGFGIVLYNIGLSGIAIGLLILGFARPAPATA